MYYSLRNINLIHVGIYWGKMWELYPRCICARGEAEGYKYHRGYNFYLILHQGIYFDPQSKAEGIKMGSLLKY